MKILVIEDDQKVGRLLKRGLGEEGYVVDVCHDGEEGLSSALAGDYGLIVLDVMLPYLDGWNVLDRLRSHDPSLPVLMLSAKDAVAHRIRGLSLGADDYLVKPFAFGELSARIRAVLRRNTTTSPTTTLQFEDLTVDPRRGLAERGGRRLDLTTKELQLLELLMRHPGEVLSRTYIAETVWEMSFDGDSNVIDVNIRRLRSKIDDPYDRKLIATIRGRGYAIR